MKSHKLKHEKTLEINTILTVNEITKKELTGDISRNWILTHKSTTSILIEIITDQHEIPRPTIQLIIE